MQYFTIKNWQEFQHYKTRSPIWIKLYLRLLNDDDFLALPERQQRHLIMLWLLMATRKERCLPLDPKRVGGLIAAQSSVDFDSLIDAGWLELLPNHASNNDELCYPRSISISSSVSLRIVKKKTSWPEGLVLSLEMRQYALARRITDPDAEFEAWKDDCAAHNRCYADWTAAWRTRVRNAPKFAGRYQQSQFDVTPIGPRNTGALQELKAAARLKEVK